MVANVERLYGDMTMVMVAHRLTTITRCDRIVVLEHGRVTGVGPTRHSNVTIRLSEPWPCDDDW